MFKSIIYLNVPEHKASVPLRLSRHHFMSSLNTKKTGLTYFFLSVNKWIHLFQLNVTMELPEVVHGFCVIRNASRIKRSVVCLCVSVIIGSACMDGHNNRRVVIGPNFLQFLISWLLQLRLPLKLFDQLVTLGENYLPLFCCYKHWETFWQMNTRVNLPFILCLNLRPVWPRYVPLNWMHLKVSFETGFSSGK